MVIELVRAYIMEYGQDYWELGEDICTLMLKEYSYDIILIIIMIDLWIMLSDQKQICIYFSIMYSCEYN